MSFLTIRMYYPLDKGVPHHIKNELDYEREAQNLISMGKNLDEFELIQIPQPVRV